MNPPFIKAGNRNCRRIELRFDDQVDDMAKAAQSCAIRFRSSGCFETFDRSIVVGSIIEDVMSDLVGNTVFLSRMQ